MDWEFPSKVMEEIPVIPSRGLPWKKVYGLIGLTGIGIGTAVGTTTWGGVENGNKNAILVQNANLEIQKAGLEAQTEELKKENKRIKVTTLQDIYRNRGQIGQDLQLQDISLALQQKGYSFKYPCDWTEVCRKKR